MIGGDLASWTVVLGGVASGWIAPALWHGRPRTVLWGARNGDVVYGSRTWRRRNIPIGANVITVASTSPFDVGSGILLVFTHDSWDGVATYRVVGIEPPARLGVESAYTPQRGTT